MQEPCVIRAESAADADRIAELTGLAFGKADGVEVEMVARIRASADFIPELSIVAEASNELVGHCLISRTRLDNVDAPPVLLLGPLSVAPAMQRRGIGGRLVRAGIAAARKRPEPLIALLGHPWYYPRFGFGRASEFGIGPDWPAAMIYPLVPDLTAYKGAAMPH